MFGVVDEGVVAVALTVVAVDGAVEDEDGGEASKVRWCIGLVLLHAATTTFSSSSTRRFRGPATASVYISNALLSVQRFRPNLPAVRTLVFSLMSRANDD